MSDAGVRRALRRTLPDGDAGRTSVPARVYLYPTLRCNLRCRSCYTRRPVHERIDPCRIAAELVELGASDFDVSGGEPLLFEGLVALCRIVKGVPGNTLSLVTNGTLVASRRGMLERVIDVVDTLAVSIDAGTAAAHEAVRGLGTFEAACEGARLARRWGVPRLVVNTVLHPETEVTALAAVVDVARAVGADGVHFMERKWERPEPVSQHRRLRELVARLLAKDRSGLEVSVDVPPAFHPWPATRNEVRLRSRCVRGCRAFDGEMAILPNGDVTGCVDLVGTAEFVAGNVRDAALPDVLAGMRLQRARIAARRERLRQACGRCSRWSRCGGGCPVAGRGPGEEPDRLRGSEELACRP